MKLVPLGSQVILKRSDAAEYSSGGIALPDSVREKPGEGRVLSVGDGRRLAKGGRAKHEAHEGDRVLFSNHVGTEIVIDGERLLILDADQILAILS